MPLSTVSNEPSLLLCLRPLHTRASQEELLFYLISFLFKLRLFNLYTISTFCTVAFLEEAGLNMDVTKMSLQFVL